MSARWQQLEHPVANTNDAEDEEEGEEEENDGYFQGSDVEEEEEDVGEEGGEQDEPEEDEGERVLTNEDHRISVADSFWDDDATVPPPNDEEDHAIIDVLSHELMQQDIPSYLDQFEIVIPDAELVVGSVPLEDVQRREREIEEAQIRRKQAELDVFQQRETRLAQREHQIRDELRREAQRKHEELVRHKLQAAQVIAYRTRRLGYVFQQAESHLKAVLQRQQARVREVFGHIDHSQRPAERKQYKLEWAQIPVTLKIRVKTLRALRDKLPKGKYVLLVTLYDRLGGHALHWTAWDPEKKPDNRATKRRRRPRPGSHNEDSAMALLDSAAASSRLDRPNVTRPFRHRGRLYDTDIAVNQDVFVVCPSQTQLRPSNVLVFELFSLENPHRNRRQGMHVRLQDEIVAWGAMPIGTPDFTHIEGKFKIPLLRGEMDATMDKFSDIEKMYTSDLSAWLCNMYFHVTHVKDDADQWLGTAIDECDVEIDQRNGLFRAAQVFNDADGPRDAIRIRKKSHPEEITSVKTAIPDNAVQGSSSSSATVLIDVAGDPTTTAPTRHTGLVRGWWTRSKTGKKGNRVYAGDVVTPQLDESDALSSSATGSKRDVSKTIPVPTSIDRGSSRSVVSSIAEDASVLDDEDLHDLPTPLDVENYRFSVNASCTRESAHHLRFQTSRKLHYLRHELFVDLGISRRTVVKMEFWLLVLMLVCALWLRVYMHYVMQWVFLKAKRVPVFYFQPQWTTCVIKYTAKTVSTLTELGVVVMGVLGNWLLFVFLAIAAFMGQTHVGELPAFGSKFLVCVGLATVLDPFLIFLVDLVHHQYDCTTQVGCTPINGISQLASQTCKCVDGDAFKLYTRFLATEGSGIVGVLLTVIVYAALTCLSLVTVYMYLLHIHMNGRMLDVYRRIHSQESDLFVPHDCEVSLHELKAICDSATLWKGPRGMQRKVFIHDYVLEDPLDPTFQEKTTHIAVYTIGLEDEDGGGTRRLYRHFLKSHDGAIIELFGEVGTDQDGSWQHAAAPGAVKSMAMLYNILQDHRRDTPASKNPDHFEVL